MSDKNKPITFMDNKITPDYTITDYAISPNEIPIQITQNVLRQFIIDILKEKGLLDEN